MIVIMNPPYSRNLHLKILDSVMTNFPNSEIVNLSPIRWLQDPVAQYKKNTDYKRFENIRNHIAELDVLSGRAAQDIFQNVMAMDLGIYHICNNGGHFDSSSLIDSICKKVIQKKATFDKFDYNQKDGWRVRISAIGGGKSGGSGQRKQSLRIQKFLLFKDGMKDGKKWYEFYMRNQYSKTTDEITCSLPFDSETEGNNFVDTMSTKFACYYFHNMEIDIHIYPQFFLKLDYTRKWSDEDLYDYFGLTEDEIKEVEKICY